MTDGILLEQTVLGHAVNDYECFQLFAQDVDHSDFSAPNHRVLAFCIKRMAEMGIKLPDEDSFQLVVAGYPEDDKDYGGAEYVRMLKQGFSAPTDSYSHFIGRLKLNAVKAEIGKKHLEGILKAINNPTATASDVRSALDSAVASLESIDVAGFGLSDSKEMALHYVRELDNRATRPFYTTGLPALDEVLTEGFAPSKITVMAGFTGMAKSTTAATMLHRVAVRGIGTAIFSMEAQREGVWDKLVSSLTQIPLVRLKKEAGNLSVDERGRIDRAVQDLAELPILINDRASMSMADIRHQLLAAQRRGHDPKVIFIDLFGKLEDVDTGGDQAAKIQMKIKMMRVMAQELDVHFVLLVQIGRQGFGRTRSGSIKRPTLIDIKNSNAYAEEPDLVLLLHRNKYYDRDLDDDILEICVAKQRDGESDITRYFEIFPDRSTIMSTHKFPNDF